MLSSLLSENTERVNILSSRSSRWSSRWKDWRRKEIFTLVSLKGSKYSQASFIIQTTRHLCHYYCLGKLRDVEVMCQENEAEGGEIIRKVIDPSFSAIDCISYFTGFGHSLSDRRWLCCSWRGGLPPTSGGRGRILVCLQPGCSKTSPIANVFSMVIGLCLAESSI